MNDMIYNILAVAFGFSIDVLWVEYIKAVDSSNPMKAANMGTLIYLVSAICVNLYIHNIQYLPYILLGCWIGTYWSVTKK
jgi:hypothetical protein